MSVGIKTGEIHNEQTKSTYPKNSPIPTKSYHEVNFIVQ